MSGALRSISCGLEEISTGFSKVDARLQKPVITDLSRCGISSAAHLVCRRKNVSDLNLSRNCLQALDRCAYRSWRMIKILNLSYNQLSTLPDDLDIMQELQYLNVSHNTIIKLPAIILLLPALQQLDISFNQLSTLPVLSAQNLSLKSLNMSHNLFEEVPTTTILSLGALHDMDLSFNQLITVSYSLASHPSLQSLRAEKNPLKGAQQTYAENNQNDLLFYLKECTEMVPQQAVKVMLLGDKNAGKTSIRNALCGQLSGLPFGFRNRLDSAKQETLAPVLTSFNKEPLQVMFIDPPGESHLAPAVQYFLSAENMIVMLVFDGAKASTEAAASQPNSNSKDDNELSESRTEWILRRWLSTVSDIVLANNLGRSCRTILVATRFDQCKTMAFEACVKRLHQSLATDFGSSTGLQPVVIMVDALQMNEVQDQLWQCIQTVAAELLKGVSIPKYVAELPAQLSAYLKQPSPSRIMSLATFLDLLCSLRSGAINKRQAELAFAALKRSGKVMGFSTHHVVLDPSFFGAAVMSVMDDPLQALCRDRTRLPVKPDSRGAVIPAEKGVIARADLQKFLEETVLPGVNSGQIEALINLLISCDVLLRPQDDEVNLIIPTRLPNLSICLPITSQKEEHSVLGKRQVMGFRWTRGSLAVASSSSSSKSSNCASLRFPPGFLPQLLCWLFDATFSLSLHLETSSASADAPVSSVKAELGSNCICFSVSFPRGSLHPATIIVDMDEAHQRLDLTATFFEFDIDETQRCISKLVAAIEISSSFIASHQLCFRPAGPGAHDDDEDEKQSDLPHFEFVIFRSALCPSCFADGKTRRPLVKEADLLVCPSHRDDHRFTGALNNPAVPSDVDLSKWSGAVYEWSSEETWGFLREDSALHDHFLRSLKARRRLDGRSLLSIEATSALIQPLFLALDYRHHLLRLCRRVRRHCFLYLESLAERGVPDVSIKAVEQAILSVKKFFKTEHNLLLDLENLLSRLSASLSLDKTKSNSNASEFPFVLGNFRMAEVEPLSFDSNPDSSQDHLQDYIFFLSHRGPDTKEALVRPLSFVLAKLGLSHFFDQSDVTMQLGHSNVDQISRAAWTSRVGVIVLSDNFAHSEWCLRELNTFLLRLRNLTSSSSSSSSQVALIPVYYAPHLLSSPFYKPHIDQISSIERHHSEAAHEFLVSLVPRLLQLPTIQGISEVQAAQKLLSDNPDLLCVLWNQYADDLCHKVQLKKFALSSSARTSISSSGC